MPVHSINGETIYYIKEGNGPAVALIHGLGASVQMWRDTIGTLKDRYTLIACDARGHGQSSAKGECTVASAAQDLNAVLSHLGVSKCSLVGISTGVPVALTLNVQSPGLVRAMVLVSAAATSLPGSKERVEATAEAIAYVSMEEFGTQYAAETLLPATPLPVQDELAGMISKMNPKVYIQLMRSAVLGDFSSFVPAVEVPVLVLAGEQDEANLNAGAQALANAIPGATFQIVPEAGHLACLDNPAAFAATVGAFLDAHR
jgi:pimeloyl-ACP methyl ester carboxylesterase